MLGRLPSLTAVAVAALRGMSDDPRSPGACLDPYAAALLPWPLGPATRGLRAATQHSHVVRQGLRYGLLGLWDHLLLRTLAIDHAVEDAARQGIRQVVVLGAGLDARASRIAALSDSRVWEVDHPATQALKARTPTPHPVHFVGVDFGRDDLDACLQASGHDPTPRTTWVWEGVPPSRPEAATRATLAVIAARSAPGSVLAVTYARPELSAMPTALRPLHALAFRTLGEPLAGVVDAPTFASWLDIAGFDAVRDTGSPDWAHDHGRGHAPAIVVHERLVLATRR